MPDRIQWPGHMDMEWQYFVKPNTDKNRALVFIRFALGVLVYTW